MTRQWRWAHSIRTTLQLLTSNALSPPSLMSYIQFQISDIYLKSGYQYWGLRLSQGTVEFHPGTPTLTLLSCQKWFQTAQFLQKFLFMFINSQQSICKQLSIHSIISPSWLSLWLRYQANLSLSLAYLSWSDCNMWSGNWRQIPAQKDATYFAQWNHMNSFRKPPFNKLTSSDWQCLNWIIVATHMRTNPIIHVIYVTTTPSIGHLLSSAKICQHHQVRHSFHKSTLTLLS